MELLNVVEDRTAAIHLGRKRKEGKKKQVKAPPAPEPEERQDDFLSKFLPNTSFQSIFKLMFSPPQKLLLISSNSLYFPLALPQPPPLSYHEDKQFHLPDNAVCDMLGISLEGYVHKSLCLFITFIYTLFLHPYHNTSYIYITISSFNLYL